MRARTASPSDTRSSACDRAQRARSWVNAPAAPPYGRCWGFDSRFSSVVQAGLLLWIEVLEVRDHIAQAPALVGVVQSGTIVQVGSGPAALQSFWETLIPAAGPNLSGSGSGGERWHLRGSSGGAELSVDANPGGHQSSRFFVLRDVALMGRLGSAMVLIRAKHAFTAKSELENSSSSSAS